jgi:hypothetical protein
MRSPASVARLLPRRYGPVGNCYHTSEALYYLLGGKAAGWKPMRVRVHGGPHWFLQHKTGVILDATVAQFGERISYDGARGCGFLTKRPSRRAKLMMEQMVFFTR